MTYIRHLLKAYPVSCFYILMIWILCFATIPSTPLDNVTLIDKWVHIAMYGGTCATIWLEYLRLHTTKRQPVMRIASPADKPLLSWTKLFCLSLDCAHTDERRHRDSAGILHGRTPQRRLARLRSQLNRSDNRCGRRRRNGDAKETPPILKRRHIIHLFVFACFLSFYSYKLMLQEQTPIEWL